MDFFISSVLSFFSSLNLVLILDPSYCCELPTVAYLLEPVPGFFPVSSRTIAVKLVGASYFTNIGRRQARMILVNISKLAYRRSV